MPTSRELLRYYSKFVRLKRRPVSCPKCGASVSPREFERHCLRHHGLDPKRCCVWCLGEAEWGSGEKNRNAVHLLDCFKSFYAQNAICDGDDDDPLYGLSVYFRELKRKRRRFLCPTCETGVTPADFERHCSERHGLDPKTCCVWCRGRARWPAGEKELHANHLIECFRKFMALNRTAACSSDPVPFVRLGLLSLEPLCPPGEFFGHEDLRTRGADRRESTEGFGDFFGSENSEGLPPEAFEQFEILDHGSLVDHFRDEGLNAAASYVRLYCETRDSWDWVHVMVKALAFRSFVDAIRKDGGGTKILPFSCWCDGGGASEALHRQHRHAVVVSSPKGRFRGSVWSGVGVRGERPHPNFQAKGMHRVESPMHLVNTLAYVSRRESRCNFKIDGEKGPFENKHFYIFEPLPVDYVLPLSVQWEGGMEAMLFQTKYQNVSADRLVASGTLLFRDCKWKQRIGDFYGFDGGRVLPLKKRFVPARGESSAPSSSSRHCHLMNGKRLVLERSEESERLDDESWLRRQAEGGNCFYEAVGDELWTFRNRDQVKLNLVMPFSNRCAELESKVEMLKRENESKDAAIRVKDAVIREKDAVIREKDSTIDRLKCEIKLKDEQAANIRSPLLTINKIKTNNKDCVTNVHK